jgi:HSP20 family protein
MALVKWTGRDVWEPFGDLPDLREELERLFGRGVGPWKRLTGNGQGAWMPSVDIVEEKDRILVRADLPGMKREDVEVDVDEGVLTIRGERKSETETKDAKAYRVERSYGSFLRSFTLPAGVDESRISASYKDGVLEIALPRAEGAKAKKVKVDVK